MVVPPKIAQVVFYTTPHASKPILMSQHPRARQPTLDAHVLLKERELNISNELKKETAAVESSTLQPWHKSAPWLISAATLLGLVIIFQR